MRRKAKIIVYTGIFVLVFLAAALARVYLLGSAPERLVKSLGQDLTGTVFRDQNYENENGNRYDLLYSRRTGQDAGSESDPLYPRGKLQFRFKS